MRIPYFYYILFINKGMVLEGGHLYEYTLGFNQDGENDMDGFCTENGFFHYSSGWFHGAAWSASAAERIQVHCIHFHF